MLVLNRKAGEKIVIGEKVIVTVTSIRGRSVRLGIEAPEDVTVLREEIIFDRRPDKVRVSDLAEAWAS